MRTLVITMFLALWVLATQSVQPEPLPDFPEVQESIEAEHEIQSLDEAKLALDSMNQEANQFLNNLNEAEKRLPTPKPEK